jgi:hypothetical protein
MIDYVNFAPTGIRNDKAIKYDRLSTTELPDGTTTAGKYVVRLNHGRVETEDFGAVMSLVDELFVFETLEDAKWFVKEGYRKVLYVGESAPDFLSEVCAHDNTPRPALLRPFLHVYSF